MQQQRIVLITGANRGLGQKLAEVLAPKYQLILTARQQEAIQKTKATLEQKFQNPKILTHQLDVANPKSVLKLKEWLIKENIKLDVLVNNAGVAKNHQDIIDINVIGTINVSEQLLPTLNPDGKIILVSSMLGKLGSQSKKLQQQLSSPVSKDAILQISQELRGQKNTDDWTQYGYSKALLNAYGRYILSHQVSPNQSVFCMHPGWIKTDMGGQNAPGTLDEGVVTSTYLVDTLPFKRDEQYHGKYFNNFAKVEDY